MENKQTNWYLPVGIILFILVIIFSATFLTNRNKTENVVKIGAVLPLTGSGAYWGPEVQKGIELALNEINKNGKVIDFVFEDSTSKADAAVIAGQKLINADGVKVLYTHFSGVSLALSPIAKANNIPFYYDAFSQTPLKDNPLSFKGFLSFDEPCEKYAKYLKAIGAKKIAVLNEFGDAHVYCKEGLRKYYSDEDIEVTETLNDADFKTLLLKLKKNNTDGVVLMTYENNSINIYKQIKELGLNFDSMFCEQSDCYADTVKAKVGFVPNLIYFDPLINDEFINKAKASLGAVDKIKLVPTAYGYEDTMRLYSASLKCKGLDSNCYNSALASDNKSYVFVNAPIHNRSYYPKLKYTKVDATGTETDINLE